MYNCAVARVCNSEFREFVFVWECRLQTMVATCLAWSLATACFLVRTNADSSMYYGSNAGGGYGYGVPAAYGGAASFQAAAHLHDCQTSDDNVCFHLCSSFFADSSCRNLQIPQNALRCSEGFTVNWKGFAMNANSVLFCLLHTRFPLSHTSIQTLSHKFPPTSEQEVS